MHLSRRHGTRLSRPSNYLSRRFTSRQLPLLVVLLLAVAAVFVFVARSRAAHGSTSATVERGIPIVERNLKGAPRLQPLAPLATTFTVNDLGDTVDATLNGVCDDGTGKCTLRAAIQEANNVAGADTIGFSVTGTIQLGSALPDLSTAITISGPGANLLTVRHNTGSRYSIFTINGSVTVAISGLTIADGKSPGAGGGIYNSGGTVTITNSTLSGSSTFIDLGGGIYNDGGTVIITNSMISGNSGAKGGGIYNSGGTVTITNSTLSGNSSLSDGGGIYNQSGTVTITNSTVSGNSCGGVGWGGGIYNNSGTVNTMNARGTIIAQNTAFRFPDVAGLLNSQGHNLIGDDSGATIVAGTGDQIGNSGSPIDPKLGPLANNGGPTQTRALLPGSPAIDAGDDCVFNNTCSPALASALTTDQRGLARQAGVHVDIGAYEVIGVLETGGPSLVVNSIADTSDGACTVEPGGCTLREAIQTANAVAGANIITFDAALTSGGAATINLTGALPDLSTDITINGPGANLLTVRHNTGGDYRIFAIGNGVTVAINGLTIANGNIPASFGGGIFNNGGTLTITNSTLSDNLGGDGGGIFSLGTLTITNSTLSGNSGGGIHITGGTVTITNSTLSGNSTSAEGGGIFNNGGTVAITNSTLSGNSSSAEGGGIFNQGGTVTLTNSTLSGNSASDGGGIHKFGGSVNARSTIIAQNTAPTGPDFSGLPGATLTSQGHNLIGDNSGAIITATTGDQIGTSGSPIDPKLGPLQNNGGPTQTRALLPGSSANDAGDDCVFNNTCSPALASPLTTDQRGLTRQAGAHVDIGAYEVNGVLETGGPSLVVNSIADTSDGDCTAEPGGCTLREAIQTANSLAGADTITFDPVLTAGGAATINLTGALPDLSTDITINGPGANLLTVRRNTGGDYCIFTIRSGVTAAISGLTIANGKGTGGLGGGIDNNGTVTITNSTLSGNSASGGGGIFNKGGSTLTINNSTLSGNSASSGGKVGGGIFNAGTVTITNSTLSGNSSDSGGGIHSEVGTLTITNSTLSGNSASGGFGGGIENAGAGTATITNSTLSGNSSAAGGGIYNNSGTVNARSTIIAQNTAPSGPDVSGSAITSQGHNLIGDNSDATVAPATGDQIGTSGSPIDPKLGPLQSNGGPTQTRALLPGSTAIDAGDDCVFNNTCSPALGSALTTDQRGGSFSRLAGAHVDIGAYEVNGVLETGGPSLVVNSIADTSDGACTAEPGGCTLREAISTANALAGANTITFDPALTAGGAAVINLTSALPDLSSDMTITGPGANLLTVMRSAAGGTPNFRIFKITSGTVNISGFTISGGNDNNGGALANAGTLTLTNCTVSGNTSGSFGGGVISNSGTLTLNNSTVSGNTAGGPAGNILNHGTLTLTNSTVSGNAADGGAGILNVNGTLNLTNSTVSGNICSGLGGGIANNTGGTVNLSDSTVSGNTANLGGGIYNTGIANLKNSIIAGNSVASGGSGPDLSGTFNSQDYNLIGNTSDAIFTGTTTHDIVNTPANLGPLANNGGPTQTHLPLPGSPAINAGDPANLPADTYDLNNNLNTSEPLPIDQRGFPRVVGANFDIGAVETNYAISATAGTPQSTFINTAFATQLQATVTESAIPANGATVTFTAPGSGASGTFPGNLTTVNVTTNASGVATAPVFTANGTAGGPYNVVASIGAGLPTANFALTNLPGNQVITVNTHAPGSATYNTSFTVAATASSGLPVVYSSAGVCTNVGPTFTMTSGVGTCMVKYDQPGDSNNNPAPQIVETVTAQKATQTITFGALANRTFGDPDFMVSATASSGLPVSFSASGQCTVTSPSPGTVHITGGGSCTITASQAGDATYDVAPQVQQGFNIGKANQTITFGQFNTKKFGDADFNVSATASSGLPVSFAASGNCSISGNTVHLTGAGLCTITASQAGNGNFNAAPDVARSFEIDKADQTANVLPQNLPNRTFGDPDFNITGGASSDLPVTFSATGNCTVTPGGAPNTATVHLTGAGSCTLTATQAGNANYNPATGSQTFQINKANQTITFGALANKTFGDADLNVSATASSGLTVSFTATGNCTISGNTVHLTAAGSCTITASQAGDANYNAAPSVPQSFTISKANQTITFGALANKTFGDADFNVSATASSGLPVSFTATGNCTIAGNTVHLTGAGSCTITASQAGDSNYNAAPNVPQSFTIAKANQTITFGALANKMFGDADFNVSATASSGLPVSFTATGNCSITGNTVHLTGAGSCTITASQPGNANFNAAPDVPQSFTINKAATTTSLTSSVNPSALGQSVTFTATVNPAPNTTTPTGTVQFKDGGVNLGAAVTLNASGAATLTTSALTAGTHAITAEYSGNTNFNPSTGSLSQAVSNRALLKFSQSGYHVGEDGKFITITVNRSGDLTPAVTVDYASPDDSSSMTFLPCSTVIGIASSRCDFTTAIGTLRFASGEPSKTFDVLISQDTYVEGPETFPLTLANPTGGAAFAQPADALCLVTIDDDDSGGVVGDLGITESNPIDDNQNFVRQHYHDFLNREPDAAGLSFWTSQITNCGANQACIDAAKVSVSASFFLSTEFQQTGYYVERTYKSGFGDIAPPAIPVPVRFIDFLRDTQEVGRGIIVGQGQWQAQLDANKRAFALAFVQRADFTARYPALTSATAFVTLLNTNAGNVLTPAEQTALIVQLSPSPADATLRANVLFQIAENQKLQQQESNRAFVLMEYFGYLRRNPDAAPDSDFTGFNFWLNKLNQANGDFVKAEMVKAFLTSNEYRQRFGP